jgi:hypothetical protein
MFNQYKPDVDLIITTTQKISAFVKMRKFVFKFSTEHLHWTADDEKKDFLPIKANMLCLKRMKANQRKINP